MAMTYIRICAVLIGLRSLTNFGKLFQGDDAVIVVFGHIVHGSDVVLPALLIGLFMLVTAIAMWKPSAAALPLIAVYSVYVFANLILWTVTNSEELVRVGGRLSSNTDPGQLKQVGLLGMFVYSSIAMLTTAVPTYLLWKQRTATSR